MRTTEHRTSQHKITKLRHSAASPRRHLTGVWGATVVIAVLVGGVAAADVAAARQKSVGAAAATPAAHPSATKEKTSHVASPNVITPTSIPQAPGVQAVPDLQVLTIGDSIMKGFGLDEAGAWPELLADQNDWQLTSLATNGAGFLAEGSGGNTYGDLVQSAATLHPDLIIIEGSSNDFGQPNDELAAATTSTVALLRSEFANAKIIGLSTVWSETTPPAQTAAIDAQVQAAVTAVGGTYLELGQPLSDRGDLMQGDDVHPTAGGQVVLSTAIGSAVEAQLLADRQAIVAHSLEVAPGHI